MLPRVWAPDLDPVEKRASLPADESAHVSRVLRLGPGARVLVFDGRGAQYLGEVTSIGARGRARTVPGSAPGNASERAPGQAPAQAPAQASAKAGLVSVALLEPVAAAAEPRVALTLAQAVLKGDKMDVVIRDATMMGLSTLVPLVTDRTVVPLSALEQGRARDRWHRVAVASAKQCGRAVVPAIAAPCRLPAWLEAARAARIEEGLRLQLVEPSALTPLPASAFAPLPTEPPARVLIAIGPEGGWSPDEIAAARAAGYQPWTLGARTLRAESAALAALSVLTYVWHL